MNDKEIDELIDLCKRALRLENQNFQGLSKEYFCGYEKAMLQVMVYLYSRKRVVEL